MDVYDTFQSNSIFMNNLFFFSGTELEEGWRDKGNDHSSNDLSVHKALACPEGQSG